MNKIALFSLCIISVFILSGCLQIPLGYTPSVDFPQKYKNQKYAVTFSVDYIAERDDVFGLASKEKYIKWLKDDLQKSGAFSSVTYIPFSQKSNYHIHFLIHYSYMTAKESMTMGLLMGYTFLTIPMWQTMYLDMSAILYLNGSPIHSPTTAEALRCYVWAPFLPIGLVWNQWWAWTTQEKKCYRYLVKDLIEFQIKTEEELDFIKEHQEQKQKTKPFQKSPQIKSAKKNTSFGTGFAVGENIIITARHVIENKKSIKVCFDGKHWIKAKLVKQSDALDIAVLEVSSKLTYILPLTAEEKAYAGDRVFTFGYPVVQILGSEIKYSEGAISSMSGLKDDQTLIQTTVPIQPGNSGSPLLNEYGEVIGMLTSTAALPSFLKFTGTIPQNINWAVKAEYISILMDHQHHKGKAKFKNRRELMKTVRQATCQILAE
jgi:hypothetical protein